MSPAKQRTKTCISSCQISLVSRVQALTSGTYSNDLHIPDRTTYTSLNSVGYARIILAAFALYYMPYHPYYCAALYGASALLDAADGYAARTLGQASQFGAVLDMIVDRHVHFRKSLVAVLNLPSGAQRVAFYATSHLRIQTMPYSFKDLSASTSRVTTCTWSGGSSLFWITNTVG